MPRSPTRTGLEDSYPCSQSSWSSGSRRSPATPYMIWSCSGSPAAALRSHWNHALASSRCPDSTRPSSVNVASRTQQ